jgi:hypothetical protein
MGISDVAMYPRGTEPEPKAKPIDRWLGLGAAILSVVTYLEAKTPVAIVVALTLIFCLAFHPLWNFWWVEKTLTRRLVATASMIAALALYGAHVWPHAELPQVRLLEVVVGYHPVETRHGKKPQIIANVYYTNDSDEDLQMVTHYGFQFVDARGFVRDPVRGFREDVKYLKAVKERARSLQTREKTNVLRIPAHATLWVTFGGRVLTASEMKAFFEEHDYRFYIDAAFTFTGRGGVTTLDACGYSTGEHGVFFVCPEEVYK